MRANQVTTLPHAKETQIKLKRQKDFNWMAHTRWAMTRQEIGVTK